MDAMERIERAANAVTAAIGTAEIAVILGSGLGDFGNALENAREIAYQDIPGVQAGDEYERPFPQR